MIIHEMTRAEIDAVLSESRLGRLACVKDNRPYVVPIHFAFAENHLYSFSLLGRKIEWMRMNPWVCVQVDQFSGKRTWRSVVVNGVFHELPEDPVMRFDRGHAWDLLRKRVDWWEPGGLKPSSQRSIRAPETIFYRIQIESSSGRQATVDDEF